MPFVDPVKRAEYAREWRRKRCQEDADYARKDGERIARNKIALRERANACIAEFRRGGCLVCGESDDSCLDAHHLDASAKEFNVGSAVRIGFSVNRITDELKKCVCLCSNCHRKFHAGRLELPVKQH